VFDGLPGYSEGVIYDDGTKADFNIVRVELLRQMVANSQLPAELDQGYRVLLDKDGLAACLPPPTFRAYLPPKPSAQRYQEVVEEFWWETTYVATYLWRDELVAARTVLDRILRSEVLHPMLESGYADIRRKIGNSDRLRVATAFWIDRLIARAVNPGRVWCPAPVPPVHAGTQTPVAAGRTGRSPGL
jgi:hypothetical protein